MPLLRRKSVPAVPKVLVWEDYTGKAPDPTTVAADGAWHLLPLLRELRPVPASGREDHMMYARMVLNWAPDATAPAALECKFVRGDGDATAYDLREYAPGRESVPFQQTHFERGQKGLAGAWWVRFSGGIQSVTLTTRYAKTAVVAVQA